MSLRAAWKIQMLLNSRCISWVAPVITRIFHPNTTSIQAFTHRLFVSSHKSSLLLYIMSFSHTTQLSLCGSLHQMEFFLLANTRRKPRYATTIRRSLLSPSIEPANCFTCDKSAPGEDGAELAEYGYSGGMSKASSKR